MKLTLPVALLLCCVLTACRERPPQLTRTAPTSSGWIEEAAVKRGYIKPGDVAQFGCPPGWRDVEDTVAALRGNKLSAVYRGADPPPAEATITCVAQAEFALPDAYLINASEQKPLRQPLAPVWIETGVEATTIGFRSEVPLGAAIYFARETPCGPRIIGVRLGDLLNWLTDPQTAPKRDFLGMLNGGC